MVDDNLSNPIDILMRRQIEKAVLVILDESDLEEWWNLPIPAFNGFTPQEMFDAGQGGAVLSYTQTYSESSFS